MFRRILLKPKLKFKSPNYSYQLISLIPEDDINQVLNAETPFEFRRSKFDSIILFLMNTHSNELRELEKEKAKIKEEFSKELYGVEKEKAKIKEEFLKELYGAEKEIAKVKEEFSKEFYGVEKEKAKIKEEFSKELYGVEKEKDKIKEELSKELSEAEKELLKEKFKVEKLTVDFLQSRGKLNVRGALEYCRAKILGSKVRFRFEEPFDNALKELEKNENFIKVLKNKCKENKTREKDVIHCIGGLYHNASKDFHGHNFDAVEIVMNSWSENEIIALASIFTFCEVRYVVLDKYGQPVNICP
jgi:hypothetical protein